MKEAGADAARQAKRRSPAPGEEAAGQKPRDAEAEPPPRRRAGEAAEESAELAAKKAAEMPAAMAAARTIAEANDAVDTPVLVVIGLLNALKLRYRWIRSFTARPKLSAGHFSLWMIASETEVESDYTERLLAQERARQRRIEAGERFSNFRRKVDPKDIEGAPPPAPGAPAGHAKSKHGVTESAQADLLNNPERIFSGKHAGTTPEGVAYERDVDIYYRDESVVITEAGKKHSVITAYGKIATKGKIKPVDPAEFADSKNFVEIDVKGPSNEVIFPSRKRWEAQDWP